MKKITLFLTLILLSSSDIFGQSERKNLDDLYYRNGIYFDVNSDTGYSGEYVENIRESYSLTWLYYEYGNLENGYKVGKITTWFWKPYGRGEPPQQKSHEFYIVGIPDIDGELYFTNSLASRCKDGKETYWYRNGKIQSITNYRNCGRSGKYVSYYENGQIEEKGHYKHLYSGTIINIPNKDKVGEWVNYYGENGQLKSKINYNKNAKLDGQYIKYSLNGEIIINEIYKNGKLIE